VAAISDGAVTLLILVMDFDDLDAKERRKLCRSLLDKVSPTEQDTLHVSVLLLMAQGMTEREARDDVMLRARQSKAMSRKVPW